ncbi:Rft protein-domain-containing protein [Leucosporidium creatinivorum]|uniref:Man(5)GlcNAc(2)-PP-dolichol translocation protein RFT1 n=1 Tax=Leucosporidium creatinivorum TaxID=106004 RepID=A0A1Y2EN24_9BASI|nr:Rft protein-domain-containing protein [Leucosporidium creatinivorum]
MSTKASAAASATSSAPSSSPLLSTTLSLVLLQLVSRLFSFSLNQLLLRSTTPQALGVATMGFEVVRDTGLFLVREGMRGAVVRTRSSASNELSPQLSRTLLLPTYLAPLPILFFGLYSFLAPSPLPTHFYSTLSLYALSAVLELLGERWYLHTLLNWETLTSVRVKIEGAAVGVKSVATLAAVFMGGERAALLAFGVGQVAYGATLLVGFWWRVGAELKTGGDDGRYDPEVVSTSWALTKQSLVKQLLTEGDKIAVGRLSKVEDQGGYAVALNYGSLIARILFAPLEETSRLFFSRHLSITQPSQADLLSTSTLLSSLLTLHTHLSLIFILFAPPYTAPLLYHLLGARWSAPLSSAPTILRAYCTYLPFLAINGVTEAFFQSAAGPEWLKRGSWWMAACSVGFLGAVIIGARAGLGEVGLIYANCLNMSLRIAFSSVFIRRFYKEKGAGEEVWKSLSWRRWAPKLQTVVVFGIAGVVVRRSEAKGGWKSLRGMAEHLGEGAACGFLCLAVIFVSERKNLRRLAGVVRRKRD